MLIFGKSRDKFHSYHLKGNPVLTILEDKNFFEKTCREENHNGTQRKEVKNKGTGEIEETR